MDAHARRNTGNHLPVVSGENSMCVPPLEQPTQQEVSMVNRCKPTSIDLHWHQLRESDWGREKKENHDVKFMTFV